MVYFILEAIITFITSFYFFPFELKFLPEVNTKMILAGMGLVLCGINLGRGRKAEFDKSFLTLSIWAIAISFISYFSTVINSTIDPSYTSYIISMWVWLGGAYFVIKSIESVHKRVSVELICHYLIAVCTFQCILAFSMGQIPSLKAFIDGFLGSEGFMGRVEGRLYGLGASLDVAGIKFSAILVTIAYLAYQGCDRHKTRTICYIIAFLIISVVGNMIGRSTTIGIIVSLVYWTAYPILFRNTDKTNIKHLWICLISTLLVIIPIIVYQYNTNIIIRNNLRFGFEGFFSLAEKGRWEVNSTDILVKHMYVFPDNLKTWLIGDGYMANPDTVDPFYTGKAYHGFYKGTDVGYIRFIFYFGILGLLMMIVYMAKVCQLCINKYPNHYLLFLMVLFVNYIVWFKVSTDLFVYFALFLCIHNNKDENFSTINIKGSTSPAAESSYGTSERLEGRK